MQKPIRIDLSRPPSVNACYKSVGGNRRAISKEYASWKRTAEAQCVAQGLINLGLQKPYRVWYLIGVPDDKRRRDVANYEKPLSDALVNCGIIEDDSFIRDNRQVPVPGQDGVIVYIWEGVPHTINPWEMPELPEC